MGATPGTSCGIGPSEDEVCAGESVPGATKFADDVGQLRPESGNTATERHWKPLKRGGYGCGVVVVRGNLVMRCVAGRFSGLVQRFLREKSSLTRFSGFLRGFLPMDST